MASSYIPVEMDIGSNRKAVLNINSDVATYFGITASEVGDVVVTRRRKAHTRAIYDGLSDTSSSNVNVEASVWQTVKKAANFGSGKLIRIPTKLTTGKGSTRMTSFRVPGNANIAAISKFLYTKCDANKRPSYFMTESGAKYPVANVTGDVNPGEEEATTPTP